MVKRRLFLKASILAIATVAAPMKFSYLKPEINNELISSLFNADDNYLDNMCEIYGIYRKPGENDTDLRIRTFDKYRVFANKITEGAPIRG